MEVKKSRGADLENLRVQGFLLGLIVVLASMFVSLAITIAFSLVLDEDCHKQEKIRTLNNSLKRLYMFIGDMCYISTQQGPSTSLDLPGIIQETGT